MKYDVPDAHCVTKHSMHRLHQELGLDPQALVDGYQAGREWFGTVPPDCSPRVVKEAIEFVVGRVLRWRRAGVLRALKPQIELLAPDEAHRCGFLQALAEREWQLNG